MGDLDPDALSWAALLGQCTDYARATSTLGEDDDDGRWRAGTASVVALHAVVFALRQLDRVDEPERPLARDRAAVLIREHVGRLDEIWRAVPMPDSLLQLHDDARTALDRAAYVGAVEMIWTGPGTFIVPASLTDLPDAIDRGDEPAVGTLLVMQPGTIVMPGEPVAWWTGRDWPRCDDAFDALEAEDTDVPRQVYRVLSDEGRIERDLVAPIWAEPRAGMPLLVPLLADGVPVGRFTMDPDEWEARQRSAMSIDPDAETLPVAMLDEDVELSDSASPRS
jgi:hypothetical protein